MHVVGVVRACEVGMPAGCPKLMSWRRSCPTWPLSCCVQGANDGLVSTSSLLMGVGAASR